MPLFLFLSFGLAGLIIGLKKHTTHCLNKISGAFLANTSFFLIPKILKTGDILILIKPNILFEITSSFDFGCKILGLEN